MKKLILKTDKLNDLSTELIGNGGNSRLDIMLDLNTGEVWVDEFFDHEENSRKEYDDKNIICIGTARNGILEDEETGENGCWWNVTIWKQREDNQPEEIYLEGDYYNDYYDVDFVLDVINELYGELE